ncbi:MAG: protein kinase, partial [Acidobacteria bacterium]|nr:protein kinase [Acidobacteriota bacterium]
GEVYRARDARLGREVALKVLPGEVTRGPERLSRFEQEARAASALNHPNIITIYEVGLFDTTPFIAMELVDGKTLRDLSASGPQGVRRP